MDGAPGPAAIQAFLERLPSLTPEARVNLIADVAEGRVRWVRLSIWDNADEDGDVVDIHTEFVAMRVGIRKQRQTFTLPVGAGGIRLVGIDGGGRSAADLAFQRMTGDVGRVNAENPVTVTALSADGRALQTWMQVGHSVLIQPR